MLHIFILFALFFHIMKIVLIGPPGAGKGTVSSYLQEKYNVFHLSPGELLRQEISSGTILGQAVKKYLDAGELIPGHFVASAVRMVIQDKDNYIVDGFPRTMEQVKDSVDLYFDHVIFMKVSEECAVERLSGRRVDPITGKSYHVKNLPPPEGLKVIHREDDHPENIKHRFEVYMNQTMAVIEHYRKVGLLREIDAERSLTNIYEQLDKVIAFDE